MRVASGTMHQHALPLVVPFAGQACVAAAPILYIEFGCGGTTAKGPAYRPLIRDAEWRREEARTWLTYPEWHIVYSADSFGRFLENSPPSGYPYLRDIRGFWSGYCAVNRASAGEWRSGRRNARHALHDRAQLLGGAAG